MSDFVGTQFSASHARHAAIPQPEALTNEGDREMRITIEIEYGFWEYQGTQAQLQAEGIIPAETEWPRGRESVLWEDGRYLWCLRRTRPDDLKGPMRLWTSGDWWSLRCDLLNGPDIAMLRVIRKQRELIDEVYRQSAAGHQAGIDRMKRFFASEEDKVFQAFKEKIPGLIPPKRSRKVKAATQGAQQ